MSDASTGVVGDPPNQNRCDLPATDLAISLQLFQPLESPVFLDRELVEISRVPRNGYSEPRMTSRISSSLTRGMRPPISAKSCDHQLNRIASVSYCTRVV